MATRRRWLQFSLRGFLVVLTIGCLWLGWKVERARKRGQAIDAIIKTANAYVREANCDDPYAIMSTSNLWHDLVGSPVDISLRAPIDKRAASHLTSIFGVREIKVWGKVTDADLHCLEFTAPEILFIAEPQHITQAAEERLGRRLPETTIQYLGRNFTLGHFDYQ